MKGLQILTTFLLTSTFCAVCFASPIFVFKTKEGTVRFSNTPPPEGTNVIEFKKGEKGFEYYRVGRTKEEIEAVKTGCIEKLTEDFSSDENKDTSSRCDYIKEVLWPVFEECGVDKTIDDETTYFINELWRNIPFYNKQELIFYAGRCKQGIQSYVVFKDMFSGEKIASHRPLIGVSVYK